MDYGSGHGAIGPSKFYIYTASVGVVVATVLGSAVYFYWSRRRQARLRCRYFGQVQEDTLQGASSTDEGSKRSRGRADGSWIQRLQGNDRNDANEDRDKLHFFFEPRTSVSSTTELPPGAAVEAPVGSLPTENGLRMALPLDLDEALAGEDATLCMAEVVTTGPSYSILASTPTATSTALAPDLLLASDMAYVSSAAYHPPPHKQGYQAHEVFGLPLVTLYDKDVLKKSYSGILKIKLIEANNLRCLWGKGEPRAFAVASVDGGSFRTPTAYRTINPRWNSSQRLLVRNPELGALVVRVFNDDGSQPEDLGLTAVGLASLLCQKGATKKSPFTLPLKGPAGDRACIKFECKLTLLEDADDATLAKLKARKRTDKHVKKSSALRDPPRSVQELEPVAFVDDVDTDTQVWVRWNKADRRLICAFRGTENEYKDILTDLSFVSCSFTTYTGEIKKGLKIHTGFMRAYSSVRRTLTNLLASICSLDHGGPKWKVVLTGHSLGGALATLAALELSMNKGYFAVLEKLSLYTFGSPRVGNSEFASLVDEYVPDNWRMTNRFDMVTSIPPAWIWFTHAGHPVRLRHGATTLRIGPLRSQLKQNPAEGREKMEVGVGKPPSGNMGTLTHAVFDEKAANDVTAFTAFFSCHGVSDHSCDLYARRLQDIKCVAEAQRQAALQEAMASRSAASRQAEAGVPAPPLPQQQQEPAALQAVDGREAAQDEDNLKTPLLPYNG